jgi:DNA repair exonuclease SbcCD nuclease subunit
MYRQFTPADDRIPNISVLHMALNPDGRRYVPVARSDLEIKDEIHYWALGHIHDPRVHENEPPHPSCLFEHRRFRGTPRRFEP